MRQSLLATSPKDSNWNPIRLHSTHVGRGGPVKEPDLVRWLLTEARAIEGDAVLFDELCWRIVGAGVPLWRSTLHIGTLHPQILGFGVRWRRDTNTAERLKVAHGAQRTRDFLESPIKRVITEGAYERFRLDNPEVLARFPLLHDLHAQGATDYYATPLTLDQHRGRHQAVTWASDAPGGFSDKCLAFIDSLVPAIGAVFDARAARKLASNLIETYLGREVAPRILSGHILRGQGEKLRAAILVSDLRGFTNLSDRLPGDEVIEILDDYFDAVASPVHAEGGDILKFVGDGVLAFFPTAEERSDRAAAHAALSAAREALRRIDELSRRRREEGGTALQAGIGLHLGEVIYGNVGSADRLDFTAIGPAVNLASRLEGLTKRLDRPLLISKPFAKAYGKPLLSLGFQPVRGLGQPEELFALE